MIPAATAACSTLVEAATGVGESLAEGFAWSWVYSSIKALNHSGGVRGTRPPHPVEGCARSRMELGKIMACRLRNRSAARRYLRLKYLAAMPPGEEGDSQWW